MVTVGNVLCIVEIGPDCRILIQERPCFRESELRTAHGREVAVLASI